VQVCGFGSGFASVGKWKYTAAFKRQIKLMYNAAIPQGKYFSFRGEA